MTTYLISQGQFRAETDEAAIANLLRKGWELAPQKPDESAQWQDGAWIVPPAPTYTPEAWVAHQDFAGQRPTTLLYLKLKLDAAQKSSPKLAAVQAWLDAMIVAGVTNPSEERSDYPASPYSFAEASGEALAVLNS